MNVHRMRPYFSELSLRSTTRTTRRTRGGLISSPLHPSDPGPGVDHKAPLAGANGAQNAAEAAQLATALSYHHQPRPRPNHGGKDAEEACQIGEEKRPTGASGRREPRSHAQNHANNSSLFSS